MRCKACDKVMEDTEIIWNEELKEHEELCSKCLKLIHDYEEEDKYDLETILESYKENSNYEHGDEVD